MEDDMRPGRATNIGRLLRAAAAALALLLLVGGAATVPAGAEPRGPGAENANDFVDWCFANGGDPDTGYDPYFDKFHGSCQFSDRSRLECDFWLDGSVECYQVSPTGDFHPVTPPGGVGIAPPLTRPPSGNHGGATGGTLQFDGGGNTTGQTGSGQTLQAKAANGAHSRHTAHHRHVGKAHAK
jgi:hypothetical protein